MKIFKIEIVVKGMTLEFWENILEKFLEFLGALGLDSDGAIIYEIKEDSNG